MEKNRIFLTVTINKVEITIKEQSKNAPKELRFIARVVSDPEYSKATGQTAEEALGKLLWAFPSFFGVKFEGRYE